MKEKDVMQQPAWESGSIGEMEPVTSPSEHDVEKKIILPKQLESVPKASEIPGERHRWNTNEEVAGILIAFEKHKEWQTREIKIRPPSGSMLLYSRKKVRYRKDGYCWKKRRDGKTTREDHMKLKVQGVECIYGCYVHSAILPTFHRRCYWLLQNPDIVLVHYLNVPLTDDNKISIPSLHLCSEKKEWTKEELTNQLKPMFANMPAKGLSPANMTQQLTEETVKSIVNQLLNSQHPPSGSGGARGPECTCPPGRLKCDCKKAKLHISAKASSTPTSGSIQNRLVSLLNSKAAATVAPSVTQPSSAGSNLMINSSTGQAALTAARHMMPNAPFILNLSQLQGSNGLIILSSQTATPISIINNNLASGSVSAASGSPCSSGGTGASQESLGQHAGGSVQATLLRTPQLHTLSQDPGSHVTPTPPGHCSTSQLEDNSHALSNILTDNHMATNQEGNSLISPFNGTNQMTCVTTAPSQTVYDVHSHSLPAPSVGAVQTTDSPHLTEQQMETSVELVQGSQSQIHSGTTLEGHQMKNNHPSAPHMDSLVSELNVKNELQNFNSLHLTHDEIQETLSANMPKDSQLGQANLASQHTDSIDNVEPMRTSLVSTGTDLNFDDAFDILDLTAFDQESLGAGLGHIGHTHHSSSPVSSANQLTTDTSSTSNCANCLGSQTNHTDKQETRAGIANITDFSPEWAYSEGGTKVLVTGPWYSTTSPYTLLFDGVKVTATLVQSGVLRCYCPAHVPSVVSLQVACEGYVISNTCLFEYKYREQTVAEQQTEWFGVGEDQVKLAILERLDHIEKRLSPGPSDTINIRATSLMSNQSGKTFEERIIEYCRHLSRHVWDNGNSLITSVSLRLTLLHLAAALGYTKLINTLVKWRGENSSLVLEYEVDGLSIDDHACTPLMWACARGHLDACIVLYQLNPSALNLCNREGLLPMSVARTQGHSEVVNQLTRLEAASQLQPQYALSPPTHLSDPRMTLTATSPSPLIFVSSLNSGTVTNKTQTVSTISQVTITSPPCMTTTFTPIPRPQQASTSPTLWATPAPIEDLTIEIPISPGIKQVKNTESSITPQNLVYRHLNLGSSEQRRARLMKRTSVEVLPDYPVTGFIDISKCSKTNEAQDNTQNAQNIESVAPCPEKEERQPSDSSSVQLRTSNSDPHLLAKGLSKGPVADPMISMSNRDLNSPVMFMQMDFLHCDHGLTLEDLQNDIAMETDSRSPSPLADLDEDTLRESTLSQCTDGSEGSQNQMMTLANQIIAAMPERIKSSPSHSEDLLTDEICSRRDRSSSYSSFSSASSSATPPVAEDSGISTPLEGMSFEEYRYSDLGVGTPASSLSPASSCLQSPYSFNLDSPTPTTEEFFAYFNAPSTYMEKDFSQLTLSDDEQRRLYEAAKIIQSFYRRYKDKQDFLQRQRQKEVEAAILIQSYYRRYKQYMYYKKMTQAAVLIQSQFRSYYAQKRFRKSREAATIIQNRYRAYKEHERYKKSRNAAVIIQQRFRSHYQRKRGDKGMSSKVQEMMEGSDLSSEVKDTDTSSTGVATRPSSTKGAQCKKSSAITGTPKSISTKSTRQESKGGSPTDQCSTEPGRPASTVKEGASDGPSQMCAPSAPLTLPIVSTASQPDPGPSNLGLESLPQSTPDPTPAKHYNSSEKAGDKSVENRT